MFANIFTTLIVQPLFNLLTFIYALLPGHNFGVAIIIFTIIIRLMLWPLVKKQLHHAKAMRDLQPELKRIKKETKGDKQRESMMVMELYKEKQINPFSSIGIILIQLPILFGLYAGLRKVIDDPHNIITFSYPFIQNMSWMKELSADITKLDFTLFGFIDLSRPALKNGAIYWPAMMLVLGSAIAQYFQSKQLLPNDKDGKRLRDILKDAGKGSETDSTEINAAVGRSTRYFIPVMIFLLTVNIASALSLYWLTSGIVAIFQQARVLREDTTEMEEIADKPDKKAIKGSGKARVVIEGEVVSTPKPKTKPKTKKSTSKAKSRRKR